MVKMSQSSRNDLTENKEEIDLRETWDEEDLEDLSRFSLSHSENPHESSNKTPETG
jgi:hypothetical protein